MFMDDDSAFDVPADNQRTSKYLQGETSRPTTSGGGIGRMSLRDIDDDDDNVRGPDSGTAMSNRARMLEQQRAIQLSKRQTLAGGQQMMRKSNDGPVAANSPVRNSDSQTTPAMRQFSQPKAAANEDNERGSTEFGRSSRNGPPSAQKVPRSNRYSDEDDDVRPSRNSQNNESSRSGSRGQRRSDDEDDYEYRRDNSNRRSNNQSRGDSRERGGSNRDRNDRDYDRPPRDDRRRDDSRDRRGNDNYNSRDNSSRNNRRDDSRDKYDSGRNSRNDDDWNGSRSKGGRDSDRDDRNYNNSRKGRRDDDDDSRDDRNNRRGGDRSPPRSQERRGNNNWDSAGRPDDRRRGGGNDSDRDSRDNRDRDNRDRNGGKGKQRDNNNDDNDHQDAVPKEVFVPPDYSNMRRFLTSPLPKNNGILQCYIRRNKSGTNKLYPIYSLYLKEGDVFLMASRKRPKNKTSNYLISMDQNDLNRSGNSYLGKLRSNFVGTEFQIFDNGVNPKDTEPDEVVRADASVRCELGSVMYAANVMGSRGPRKMQVALPGLDENGQITKWKDGSGPASAKGEHTGSESDILSHMKDRNFKDLVYLINKPPRWNEQVGAYVLNFNGRVTMASVKNFQLVDPDEQNAVVLQFGRVGKDEFTMDFQWPISPYQAFAVTLSSFDSKIACD